MASYQITNLLEKVSKTQLRTYLHYLSIQRRKICNVSFRAFIIFLCLYIFLLKLFSFSSQMTSNDKDFRFMATNDLMTELQKDSIKLDDDSEKKVCRMVLKLLEDKNGEVQNLAVKWYD